MSGTLLDRIRRFGEERGWFRPGQMVEVTEELLEELDQHFEWCDCE